MIIIWSNEGQILMWRSWKVGHLGAQNDCPWLITSGSWFLFFILSRPLTSPPFLLPPLLSPLIPSPGPNGYHGTGGWGLTSAHWSRTNKGETLGQVPWGPSAGPSESCYKQLQGMSAASSLYPKWWSPSETSPTPLHLMSCRYDQLQHSWSLTAGNWQ